MERKTVLITGGNKGIGLSTTRLFLEKTDRPQAPVQYTVYVLARRPQCPELSDLPKRQLISFDLENVSAIGALIDRMGPVDILINNAGIMHGCGYDQYDEGKKRRMLAVNLEAPVALIEAVAPCMIERGFGRVVNNTSVAGFVGHPDIWYGISKAGLINATKSFARALGSKGVVINAVASSAVDTDMLETIPKPRQEQMLGAVYTHRFARPREVAEAMVWLATDCPEYINGTCLDVNNGFFPR